MPWSSLWVELIAQNDGEGGFCAFDTILNEINELTGLAVNKLDQIEM